MVSLSWWAGSSGGNGSSCVEMNKIPDKNFFLNEHRIIAGKYTECSLMHIIGWVGMVLLQCLQSHLSPGLDQSFIE